MKEYTLTEVKPRIFFLNFKDSYNMSMHFVRYQEYYESPSPKFQGKSFTLLDFMEWYSKKYGDGAFTYPRDWGGFNIPGSIIGDVWNLHIEDINKYDIEMCNVWKKCNQKYLDDKFYIIGACGTSGAMKHEIAHGFFYTQPEYRKEMTKLVKELKPTLKKKMYKVFKNIGYAKKVYIDECQAYMATGFSNSFGIKLKNEHEPFISLYEKFYKGIK